MARRITTLAKVINELPGVKATLRDSTYNTDGKAGRLRVPGKGRPGKKLEVFDEKGWRPIFEHHTGRPFATNASVEEWISAFHQPCSKCGATDVPKMDFLFRDICCHDEEDCAKRRDAPVIINSFEVIYDRMQFTPFSGYEVDVPWDSIEDWLSREMEGCKSVELEPDFQRAHVWTDKQRSRFVEFCLRGGTSSRRIYWNCAGYSRGDTTDKVMVLVDGLQRLTAVRKFLASEIPAFGTFFRDYVDSMPIMTARLRFCVNDLKTRAEVLQWYLDLNDGGVVHTSDELGKVRALLEKEKGED